MGISALEILWLSFKGSRRGGEAAAVGRRAEMELGQPLEPGRPGSTQRQSREGPIMGCEPVR